MSKQNKKQAYAYVGYGMLWPCCFSFVIPPQHCCHNLPNISADHIMLWFPCTISTLLLMLWPATPVMTAVMLWFPCTTSTLLLWPATPLVTAALVVFLYHLHLTVMTCHTADDCSHVVVSLYHLHLTVWPATPLMTAVMLWFPCTTSTLLLWPATPLMTASCRTSEWATFCCGFVSHHLNTGVITTSGFESMV